MARRAARIIIASSPTHVGNVSTPWKGFLDRCGYLAHRPALGAAYVVPVVTYMGIGGEEVAEYLARVFATFGAQVAGLLVARAFYKGVFPEREAVESQARAVAAELAGAVTEGRRYPPHPFAEKMRAQFGLVLDALPEGKALFRADYEFRVVIFCTDGARGTAGQRRDPHLPARRRREAEAGLSRLGGAAAIHLDLPDGALAVTGDPAAMIARAAAGAGHRWAAVYGPSELDAHPDHRAVARAVRLLAGAPPGTGAPPEAGAAASFQAALLQYEFWTPLAGAVGYDISQHMEAKLDALARHRTQAAYLDYAGLVTYLNAERGRQTGVAFSECLVRPQKVVPGFGPVPGHAGLQ